MPTITISSGTTTVNSPISGDTSYIVEAAARSMSSTMERFPA
jgi:hypothetical protein